MRFDTMLACSLVLGACQGDPELPPPPVDNGRSDGPVMPPSGATGSLTDSTATTMQDITGTADTTDGTTSTGTGAGTGTSAGSGRLLLTGRLLEGSAQLIPNSCQIRLHTPESIDPATGFAVDTAVEVTTNVLNLPHMYSVYEPPDMAIGIGDEVYVTTQCDSDGDGTLDPVGGYYPQLPMEPVSLPDMGIDMALDFAL
ncbi:MAG: hypothetical protein AAGF11_05380 [Myxococcota bacterium]